MKLAQSRILFLFSFCTMTFPSLLYSEGTLNVTIINNSERDFVFDHSKPKHPHTTFTIDKAILSPGETANVIGTVTANYDLEGNLYFESDARFYIKDFRQYHSGQSQYRMWANHIRSTLVNQTTNPVRTPTSLMYIAATVLLESMPVRAVE